MLRKGRFDEIFFVDLPSRTERKEIFRIHLEKRHRDVKNFNLDKLADLAIGFSGSEIEEIIVSALYDAFDDGKEITQEYIENTIKSMIPLSKTMEDSIKGTREWAKIRAKKASSIEWESENEAVRQLEI